MTAGGGPGIPADRLPPTTEGNPVPLVHLSGPALEPLSLAEAKLHLRLDGSDEDALVQSLITTSRAHIEAALGLALMTQGWRLVLDAWPEAGVIDVPLAPIRAVTAVRIATAVDGIVAIEPSSFVLDQSGRPPRIGVRPGVVLPPAARLAAVEIDLTAGYGDRAADVPAPIRQAMRLLVAHWYENREPALVGHEVTRIPLTVSDLLQSYRQVRL